MRPVFQALLCLGLVLAATAVLQTSEGPLDTALLEELSSESKSFLSSSISKEAQFVDIVDALDRLRDKLIKERSQLQKDQREEHSKLKKSEENKAHICKASAVQHGLVVKADREEKAAADKAKRNENSLILATSLRAKNLALNAKMRKSFAGEEKLLRQLLGMIDQLHQIKDGDVAAKRTSHAKQIQSLLALLETPSTSEKSQMNSLDIGRTHADSLTLQSMIKKMVSDITEQLATIKKQEERDAADVERLTKVLNASKAVHTKSTQARRVVEERYRQLLGQCEEASGKYSELAKLVLQHSKEAVRRQGVINRELAILGEMRARVLAEADPLQREVLAKAELEQIKNRAKEEVKKLQEQISVRHESEKVDELRGRDERQAALAREEAEYKKQAEESRVALEDAKKAEEAARVHAEQAAKAAADAARLVKIEKDRIAQKKLEESLKAAKAAKERLEKRRKSSICVDLTRSVTKELLGSPSAPRSAIKQCTEMGGDAAALRAGLVRIIRGMSQFNSRRCRHTISRLFSKLLRREAEQKEADDYHKLCMAGDSDKALAARIKRTKEYQLRIKVPHIARRCLKAVVDLWTKVFDSKPSATDSVFWSKKCVKGTTVVEIEAELRKLPQYKILQVKRAEQAKIERLRAEAKKAALVAAKERAERAAAEKRRQERLAAERRRLSEEAERRAREHARLAKILRESSAAYKKWFSAWKNLSCRKRTEWWQKLTNGARGLCASSQDKCRARKHWLQQYAVARSRAAGYTQKYWKAMALLRRIHARRITSATASKIDALMRIAERNRRQALKWRPMLARLRERREKVVRECRELSDKCSVAVHRYHGILHHRVNWTRERVATWKTRAREAAKQIHRAKDNHERHHYKIMRKHAVEVAKTLRQHVKTIRHKLHTWRAAQRKKHVESTRALVAEWKKNARCEVDRSKAAVEYAKKFARATAAAKQALTLRRNELAASSQESLSCRVRQNYYAKASRTMKAYVTSTRLAHRFFSQRNAAVRAAKACAHRATVLLARIRTATVRRARILATRRLAILRRARERLERAKKHGRISQRRLEAYHRALAVAHRLAARAHTALTKSKALLARSREDRVKEEHRLVKSAEEAHRKAAVHLEATRREVIRAVRSKRRAEREHRTWRSVDRRVRRRASRIRRRRLSFHRQRRARLHARRRALQAVQYAIASVAGDPHIHTFDGRSVLLGSRGDFVLLQGSNYEIQARVRFANRAAGAGYVIGIATKLPKGDVVEVARDGIAVNHVLDRNINQGLNSMVGGSLLFGRDEHNLEYIKISLDNGILLTLNWGINRQALNVAVAAKRETLAGARGLLTGHAVHVHKHGYDRNRVERPTADYVHAHDLVNIEENRASISLFAGLSVVDDDEAESDVESTEDPKIAAEADKIAKEAVDAVVSGSDERIVEIDALASAEEICKRAFTGLNQIWHLCPHACRRTSARLAEGHCIVDASYLTPLPETERRACECLFDVAAAGSSWAVANARGAVLVEDLKADIRRQHGTPIDGRRLRRV